MKQIPSALIVIMILLVPALSNATLDYRSILDKKLDSPVLDVTADPSGDLVFFLTAKAVLIYSTEEQTVLDRIPVTTSYDRIAYQEKNRLVLTGANPSHINIIRFDRIYDIDLSGRAFKGPADAKVTLVVFDDYQCPYCARLDKFIQQVMENFPNDVKYVVKHFPLSSHKFSHDGAMAALAAGKQNKFWEFHEKLIEQYNRVNEERIVEVAKTVGLDMDRFEKDRNLASSRELIEADLKNGRDIGVNGTPSLYMNGKQINNREIGKLPELIIEELGK